MPKSRRSLRDRDQDAITAAEEEKPTLILENPEPATTTKLKRQPSPDPQVRTETTTRIGLYFQEQVFQDAKSAYLVDLDSQPDPATSFARWIGQVLDRHNRLTPERRAQDAKTLGEEPKGGKGVPAQLHDPGQHGHRHGPGDQAGPKGRAIRVRLPVRHRGRPGCDRGRPPPQRRDATDPTRAAAQQAHALT